MGFFHRMDGNKWECQAGRRDEGFWVHKKSWEPKESNQIGEKTSRTQWFHDHPPIWMHNPTLDHGSHGACAQLAIQYH